MAIFVILDLMFRKKVQVIYLFVFFIKNYFKFFNHILRIILSFKVDTIIEI